jgi:hypothetical protein
VWRAETREEGVQDQVVTTDLDTLLTALYVFCDDHLTPPERRRPGRRKKLSDPELICRDLAQLGHQRTSQTLPDPLRPLKIKESTI